MGTYPSQHPRQRESLHNELDGLRVFALSDQLDIPLDIGTRGTGGDAGGPILFFDVEGNRNGLRKASTNGFASAQTGIPHTGHGHRTDLFTFATPGAQILVYIAGLASNTNRIIADESGNIRYLAV